MASTPMRVSVRDPPLPAFLRTAAVTTETAIVSERTRTTYRGSAHESRLGTVLECDVDALAVLLAQIGQR
ncbi:MAG TPA: hypothetical protein VK059_04155, partial [Nocardioidaceae bacterium]|nr:hypothetical protein [Nocardioidaceae bacterium]